MGLGYVPKINGSQQLEYGVKEWTWTGMRNVWIVPQCFHCKVQRNDRSTAALKIQELEVFKWPDSVHKGSSVLMLLWMAEERSQKNLWVKTLNSPYHSHMSIQSNPGQPGWLPGMMISQNILTLPEKLLPGMTTKIVFIWIAKGWPSRILPS